MKQLVIMLLMTLLASASKAQRYSLNIVGYTTVTVAPGYNLLANPLNAGVTNGANEIMPIIDGELILTWNGSAFTQVGYDSGFGGWVLTVKPLPSLRRCLQVRVSSFSTLLPLRRM